MMLTIYGLPKRNVALLGFLLWHAMSAHAFELIVTIEKPDGSPAPGVAIQRVLLVHNDVDNYMVGRTDRKGELRIEFHGMKTVIDGTGEGGIRFLAMPDDYRWEMSPKYFWTYPPETYDATKAEQRVALEFERRKTKIPTQNSDIGGVIWATPDVPNRWKLRLSRGKNVTVSVKDQFGDVVPNIEFSMCVDLCAPTHSGRGGEIPLPAIKTDQNGRFVIKRAGEFFYKFHADSPLYCSPTIGWWNNSVESRFSGKKEVLVFHKFIPKRLKLTVVDKYSRAPIERAGVSPAESGGGGIIQPNINAWTDKDGVFEDDRFLFADIAAKLVIFKRKDSKSAPDEQEYESYSLEMKDFDPSKDYLIELTPKNK